MARFLPAFLCFLLGMGTLQSPVLAEEGISDDAGRMGQVVDEVGDALSIASNSAFNALPLDDVRDQIANNAKALSNLNDMMAHFMTFVSETNCQENGVISQIAKAMEEGFNDTVAAFRDVKRHLRMFKLINWRLNFINSLDIPIVRGDSPCPLPYFMLNEECIYVETKVRRSFRDAKIACRAMKGSLVEPSHMGYFAHYIHKMNLGRDKEVFVGATNPSANATFTWLSGDVIENIPWQAGRPNLGDHKKCLSVKDRHYRDISCILKRIYACEKSL